ncbi:MAG: ferric reductase-like transmembrane domain-containing protein [Pseudomonadota bacterium]
MRRISFFSLPDVPDRPRLTAVRAAFVWAGFAIALVVPVALAAASPQLAWRQPVYIVAGFAGILGLALLLLQPLLAAGWLPGISVVKGRRAHRWTGALLVAAVIVHVGGLWITSPPDVIDALLFVSPTSFSLWGVLAMWSVFGAACLVALRPMLKMRPRRWRQVHTALAFVVVIGTVIHAILIEGAMETLSKLALCLLVLVVTISVLAKSTVWKGSWPSKARK